MDEWTLVVSQYSVVTGTPMNSHLFRQRQWVRSICCLLICASSWKGPIPMIHHHAMLNSASDHREAHLHVFHDEAIADECWHWHIVVPSAAGEDNGRSGQSGDMSGHLLMPPFGDSQSSIAVSGLRGEFDGFSLMDSARMHCGISHCRSASNMLSADISTLNGMLSRSCLCSVTGVARI